MKKGEKLEKMILRSRYKNISQFSKAAGVPYTTIKSFIERDLERASIDSVLKVANTLGVKIEDLIEENNHVTEKNEIYTISSQYPKFPPISAGVPLEIDGVTEKESEKISIPDILMGKWAGNSKIYITRTNGESMNRIIPHDTLIAVIPVELHELKDNDIVVYRNHGEYAVKRFEKHDDKLVFRPDSTDRSFTDDIIYLEDADELTISGKVVMHTVIHD